MLSVATTFKDGRALRSHLKRTDQAGLVLPARRDPIAILEEQHKSRLAGLVPVRIGRMSQSAFAYYRGTAAVMAADLAAGPSTGVCVVSCGDAHVSNFGFFASPERNLLFDLNDFDEAGIAPWEWDVKRLATSMHVGGRDIGLDEATCLDATRRTVCSYRGTLRTLMTCSAIDRYYYRIDSSHVERAISGNITRKAVKKAQRRTSIQLIDQITMRDDGGRLRIVDQPPVTRHVDHATLEQLHGLYV